MKARTELADSARNIRLATTRLLDVIGEERLAHAEVLVEQCDRDDRVPHAGERIHTHIDQQARQRRREADPQHREAAEAVGGTTNECGSHQRETAAQGSLAALAEGVTSKRIATGLEERECDG